MERIYTEADVNRAALKGQTIAIIGYGSQGRAHARNLRDSGHEVIVGARPGGKADRTARADGFRTVTPADAAKEAGLVALLTPDMAHRSVYANDIAPYLAPGAALLVAHGFSVLYGQVEPRADIDVILVAPKGPGDLVRREYEIGRGVPALFAVHQDKTGGARDKAMAYASGIGGTIAGAIETSFKEETETDLFGEQAVLCGGITHLIQAGFETLVEAGYAPEMAYFECLHETKLIVDLLYEGGIANMRYSISNTAEYGDITTGPRIITAETKAEMKRVLADIQSGRFVKNFVLDNRAGQPELKAARKAAQAHPIEQTGAQLRAMMPWIGANKLVDQTKN